ncbi:MAG: SRPBCC family protein [Acidimicrobiales bacterium]
MRVVVTTEIAAPPNRVWRALTVLQEVTAWDGVEPPDVADDHPRPGQHARWRSAVGPLRLTLHDLIRVIEPQQRMVAEIDVGFVHVDEEYRLVAGTDGTTTTLVTDDVVNGWR